MVLLLGVLRLSVSPQRGIRTQKAMRELIRVFGWEDEREGGGRGEECYERLMGLCKARRRRKRRW